MHRFAWTCTTTPRNLSGHEFPISAIVHEHAKISARSVDRAGNYTVKLTVDGKSYSQRSFEDGPAHQDFGHGYSQQLNGERLVKA